MQNRQTTSTQRRSDAQRQIVRMSSAAPDLGIALADEPATMERCFSPFFSYCEDRDAILRIAAHKWIAYEKGWLANIAAQRLFDTRQQAADYADFHQLRSHVLLIHVGHERLLQPGRINVLLN